VHGAAGLRDRRVIDDVLDARVDVSKGRPRGVDMADDMNLVAAARVNSNDARAGGYV
jgi:hypothetical protein